MRRFYSCFEGFRNALLRSQFSALAGGLPSKHPPSLLAKRMLGGSKADASFIADRQSRLEAWLQSVLHGVGPHGVEAEQCIDDFLLAIKPGDDVKGGKVKQSRSLYHFCKRLGLPQQTYRALWRDGCGGRALGTRAALTRRRQVHLRHPWARVGASVVWVQGGAGDGATDQGRPQYEQGA